MARLSLCPMDISLRWLNRYLDPAGATAEEVEHALTYAGFPIEERRDLPGGDTFLDVEITSNRGDCLCHFGLAREVAARPGAKRSLAPPTWEEPKAGGQIGDALTLVNETPDVCPLFTARVIRYVKVGPSPAWLVELLEAVGQRSINNVVDVTNWLTLEYGNPSHVFDLHKLAGSTLVIRWAKDGEKLTTLDDKLRTLKSDELVVADADRAQSLAGVIGGADSEVSAATTDVVLEVACWDPATIRRAARRHAIRTDAGFRFERGVDPRTLHEASRRAAAMICELSGGTPCEGVLAEGRALPEPTVIDLRASRCRLLMGVPITPADMIVHLRALEIDVVQRDEDTLRCTVPAFRIDLTREVDLIEEVARVHGIDAIPIAEALPVVVTRPQESERAMQRIGAVLGGLGFYETITFSFISTGGAEPFVPEGLRPISVDDDRRKAEPTLRPSLLPSLLSCRRANRDAQVSVPGGIRLFEAASVYAEHDSDSRTVEFRSLTLLMDVPGESPGASDDDIQLGLRLVRGAVESVVQAIVGPDASLEIEPTPPTTRAWSPGAHASITLDGTHIGQLGLIDASIVASFGLDRPVVGAELALDPLIARYPPRAGVTALPEFPGIERDLSLVVDEDVAWARIAALVDDVSPEHLEGCAFVGVYRGKQIGAGRKSVTLRMRFRDPSRTLRHEEVDPGVEAIVNRARSQLGAELRA